MSAGKGDRPRPVDGKKYRENYSRIFGRPPEGKMNFRELDVLLWFLNENAAGLRDCAIDFGYSKKEAREVVSAIRKKVSGIWWDSI